MEAACQRAISAMDIELDGGFIGTILDGQEYGSINEVVDVGMRILEGTIY